MLVFLVVFCSLPKGMRMPKAMTMFSNQWRESSSLISI
ncbi:hypothetical protein LINPERHAP1_LOCUS14833 [Linum perenne]